MNRLLFLCAAGLCLCHLPSEAKSHEWADKLMRAGLQVLTNDPDEVRTTLPNNGKEATGDPKAAEQNAAIERSPAQAFVSSLKEKTDAFLEPYKEQYKEEGKAYAEELGNALVKRLMQNRELRHTLLSVRILCWGVAIYLSLVTIMIFVWVWRVKRTTQRLLKIVENLEQMKKEHSS